MKFASSCALILTLAFPAIAAAQAPSARSPSSTGTRVAVIDIAKVLKQHPGLNQAMEVMKQDVQRFDAEFRTRVKEVESLREQTQQYEPGSAEYKSLEGRILKMQADINIEATQKKKAFLEREAHIYHSAYEEIVAEVSSFAEQNGIGLVVRFNSDPIDGDNRQSVLEGVNRDVIYQRNSNITNHIIDRLIRASTARADSPGLGTQPPRR